MATPDTRSSIVIIKSFNFEGVPRRWSNRYHVTGPETISDADFATLADAITADEQVALPGSVTIVEATWSDASTASSTNPHGITTHTRTYALVGSLTLSSQRNTPGDTATFIRYSTTQRTSKNHPIYLFNYYHGCFNDIAGDVDTLIPAQKTALEEYGTDWLAGFSDGTNTRIRCGPYGAVAQARFVPVFLTHRDFPR